MSSPSPMELMQAYRGRRVLVTGHTGFKGSWLTLWLNQLGAEVTGFALAPEPSSLFLAAGVHQVCTHREGDIRNLDQVKAVLRAARPELVLHLAAQALVRRGYAHPIETLETNVNGTAHVLEAVRASGNPCAVVVVSSDKCYENQEWLYGYREIDPLGGYDPYSMSKGATELVTSSWRRSYFPPSKIEQHGVAVASARAGNVVGGGDWAEDRIVPDCIRALVAQQPIRVRNPRAVRPWQHVLEPLGGYLLLGARLLGVGADRRSDFCEAWNFGPTHDAGRSVRELVEKLIERWGRGRWEDASSPGQPHEAELLRLVVDKAGARLGWAARWGFEATIANTVDWYHAHAGGAPASALQALCLEQIAAYSATSTITPPPASPPSKTG